MVGPSPYLQRKLENTSNIVNANKSHLVEGLQSKYPNDYLDLISHKNLMEKTPWISPEHKYKHNKLYNKYIKLDNESEPNPKNLSITGGDKILVICVDFSDRSHTISTTTIYNRFFGTTGKTFRNYYSENSYGTYIPDGIVVGWYRAPQTYAYYRDDPNTSGCDYGLGTYPHNSQRLMEDVLDKVNNDPSITSTTLSGLDIDGDGLLNRLIIVHAGGEAAYGGNCNEIWAVTWGIYPKTVKGKTFSTFATSAEYLNVSSDPQRSGIDCHEYGHVLGLPDLYDYSDQTNGTGIWSLMSSGNWGTDYAITPVHLDSWSKYQFGWVTLVINPRGSMYIDNAETNNQIVKYTTLDPSEYFLVENRQKIGFDSSLPGSGLLVWHINENKDQHTDRYCHTVSLIQADGFQDLETKANNGDLGDPFPGTINNRSFGMYTTPNSSLCCSPSPCSGTLWDIFIGNISDSSYTMSFDSVLPPIIVGSARFHTTPTGADIYLDTIYKGTTDINTGFLNIDNIPIGTVDYIISKIGYFDYTGSINIIENSTTYKLVTMTSVVETTDIMANHTECQPPCDVTIGISWTNNDPTRSGSFYPAIKINGTRIPFSIPEEPILVGPGVTIAKMFNVSNLEIGNYTICPDPNQ
jgi:M6 family metalloprotease-like protein